MKSSSLTIQMKGTAVKYFPVLLFIMFYEEVLSKCWINLKDKILMCETHSNINIFYTN